MATICLGFSVLRSWDTEMYECIYECTYMRICMWVRMHHTRLCIRICVLMFVYLLFDFDSALAQGSDF